MKHSLLVFLLASLFSTTSAQAEPNTTCAQTVESFNEKAVGLAFDHQDLSKENLGALKDLLAINVLALQAIQAERDCISPKGRGLVCADSFTILTTTEDFIVSFIEKHQKPHIWSPIESQSVDQKSELHRLHMIVCIMHDSPESLDT